MRNCRLCADLVIRDSVKSWNKPLFKSPNFAVLPSLGALVEGWLLLVPKKHFICMGAMPDSIVAEMKWMKHHLCSVLQQCYGQMCVFEHGPSKPNCNVGCSVDHAHLHFVPMTFDLASAVTQFLPQDVLWSEAGLGECRAAFSKGEDYLYLEQPIGSGRIATHQGFGSQLFRRAIATQLGTPDQFNWREHPQLLNVSATIKRMQVHNGSVLSCKSQPQAAA